jgi:hypothetical protein
MAEFNTDLKWYRATWQQVVMGLDPITEDSWLDGDCDLLSTSAIAAMDIMRSDILSDAFASGLVIRNLQVGYRGTFGQYQLHEAAHGEINVITEIPAVRIW